MLSRVAPAAMIFVPCKDGISHNEAEYSSKEQCAAGAQVLLQAVLDYDRQLAERHENTPQPPLRARSAIAISAVPPNSMLMPTRRPMAQAAVLGRSGDNHRRQNQVDDAAHQHPAPLTGQLALVIERKHDRGDALDDEEDDQQQRERDRAADRLHQQPAADHDAEHRRHRATTRSRAPGASRMW